MKVFVVRSEHSDDVFGVYTSQEAAEKFFDPADGFTLEEFDMDKDMDDDFEQRRRRHG